MDCSSAREALSARLDGEADGHENGRVDAHLQGCPACRGWSAEVADVTRRARLQPVLPGRDLTERVLVETRDGDRRAQSWPPERWLLLLVGAVMLLFTVPLLLGGSGQGSVHLAREAGVTDLALAVGVLFAAWQPWRTAGMMPVVLVLAAGLTVTSAADVLSGRVSAVEESVHTLAPTAALLLWRLRRRGPTSRLSPPGTALRPVPDEHRRSA